MSKMSRAVALFVFTSSLLSAQQSTSRGRLLIGVDASHFHNQPPSVVGRQYVWHSCGGALRIYEREIQFDVRRVDRGDTGHGFFGVPLAEIESVSVGSPISWIGLSLGNPTRPPKMLRIDFRGGAGFSQPVTYFIFLQTISPEFLAKKIQDAQLQTQNSPPPNTSAPSPSRSAVLPSQCVSGRCTFRIVVRQRNGVAVRNCAALFIVDGYGISVGGEIEAGCSLAKQIFGVSATRMETTSFDTTPGLRLTSSTESLGFVLQDTSIESFATAWQLSKRFYADESAAYDIWQAKAEHGDKEAAEILNQLNARQFDRKEERLRAWRLLINARGAEVTK